ncbi:MAG: drug/metabolite transporter (DMT)-like permease [Bacillariaceae sp.]|jgi:drug/metabolite transporter (DMT)-like permease
MKDFLSMVLVGVLWGCTNPLLRKGSEEVASSSSSSSSNLISTSSSKNSKSERKYTFLIEALKSFLNIKVWLPYVINQSGSVVFYILLANSNISMAVPICNAIALLFSFLTSSLLGEPIEKPFQTILGASLILIGVTICVSSQEE